MPQNEFFYQITYQKEAQNENIKLYAELIHTRIKNAIKATNPILFSILNTDEFDLLITEFIKSGYTKSKFMFKISDEFKKFIKDSNILVRFKFINDLMWLENSEIKLFMKDYTGFKRSKFSWQKRLKISKLCVIKRLNFRVYLKNFTHKEPNFLLGYYDLDSHKVVYREINEILYKFLILLKQNSPKQTLTKLEKIYDFNKNELETALKELCKIGVLI
ncbi:HvfC/BufC family peptide modification chaperone [Campylobacter gastrosuis]|uniref:DNA-binding domain-containing protein n=1 Tax=Campylobacter gastrosuis TaxID=2974576 RepID=A0ABT7HRG4_9BACT|nr:putative DNA-binding domain-containing protein [Campylobacter gastrosuis]MDL0088984.1 putative DNA-binding domain-containing protein [Campylobacter gastrosuis]